MGTYSLTTLGAPTQLLDLPFGVPLADWDDPRIVSVPRGISRHVVRFLQLGTDATEIIAIKEATDRFVAREHLLLRALADDSVPVVEAFGTVLGRSVRGLARSQYWIHPALAEVIENALLGLESRLD